MFTILGASGFIGGHLATSLAAEGREIFAPERGSSDVFKRPLGHVIYAIGLTADFRLRPIDTMEAHVSVLTDVLRRGTFTSLTYLSSTRVYSGTTHGNIDFPVTANPACPSDLYNLSKLAGEALCHAMDRPEVRVVRLSNVIGPGSSASFVNSLVREAMDGVIRLRSHQDSAKDYIHIRDVVELLPRIALYGKRKAYNVAGGRNVRHREWLDRLHELTGCTIEVDPHADRFDFPEIDIRSLREEFAFSPRPVISTLSELVTSTP